MTLNLGRFAMMDNFNKIVAEHVAYEEAKQKLRAVCGDERYPAMLELAKERRDSSDLRSRYAPDARMTKREAIDSVYQDVIYGRIS